MHSDGYAIVWDVVVQKIPQLLPQIESLIQLYSKEEL